MLEIKRAHLNTIIPGQGGTSAWFGAVELLRTSISIERWEYSIK
jgi:hypothetical protein